MTNRMETKAVLESYLAGSLNADGSLSWCTECHSTLGIGFDHKELCLAGALAQEIADREADHKRMEKARLMVFEMSASATEASQGGPAMVNAVSASWVLEMARRILAALAAQEKK